MRYASIFWVKRSGREELKTHYFYFGMCVCVCVCVYVYVHMCVYVRAVHNTSPMCGYHNSTLREGSVVEAPR